jgi:hypothetical protein
VADESEVLAPSVRLVVLGVVIARKASGARHHPSDLARRRQPRAQLLGQPGSGLHVALDVDVAAHVSFAKAQLGWRDQHPPQTTARADHQRERWLRHRSLLGAQGSGRSWLLLASIPVAYGAVPRDERSEEQLHGRARVVQRGTVRVMGTVMRRARRGNAFPVCRHADFPLTVSIIKS